MPRSGAEPPAPDAPTRLAVRRVGRQRSDASPVAPPHGQVERVRCDDGTQLAVLVAGTAPPLVLAHGSLVSTVSWGLLWRPLLEAGFQLLAYDLRGHGLSTLGTAGFSAEAYGRDLVTVLREFDVCDGLVVAHSAGGIGALWLATCAPSVVAQRVRGMVLASTSPVGIGDSLQNRLLAPVVFSGLVTRILRRPSTGRAFARTLFGANPDNAHVEFTRRLLAATPDMTKTEAPKAVLRYDFTGQLRTVRLPTLLVHGSRDRSVTASHVDRLLQGLPDARLERYDGAGHMVVLERADRLAGDIAAFAAAHAG